MSNDKDNLNMADLTAILNEEDRAGLVNALKTKLQSLTGQHSELLENLSPTVRKRVEDLRGIQSQHDELEAKFFEERAALEAKYQKLYQPLYTKRYEIVNGVGEIETTNEVAMDQEGEKAAEEKGVPDFWLVAMKNNEVLAEEVCVFVQLGSKLGIIVSSPDLAREVLKDHDITFANRDVPAVARIAAYGGLDIAWSPYGPEWRMLRRVCVLKMLSNSTLDSVYGLRRREVQNTVAYIYSKAGSPINVGEQTFLTILNVVTSMLWGGTVQGEERGRLGAEFRRVVADMTALLGAPNISDFFPALARFDLQGLARKMSGLAPIFDQIFDRMIEKQLNFDALGDSSSECKDFLQFLLKVKDEGDVKTPLTMTHIKALLMDMVLGGSDTSSNAIEFAIAEVMNKPEVMRKAQDELDNVVGKDNMVEESHIYKLSYLHAIMKETLRLHPVLPLLIPHCPSETCTIGGYSVPKGSRIFINVWAVHRDPSIWENPIEFKPERFLDSKFDYSGRDFNYFPFGSGRRICAGIAMAERMFLYFLATLLHSFDWKLPAGEKVDLTEKFGIVLKLKNPLVATPTPRLSNPALYR